MWLLNLADYLFSYTARLICYFMLLAFVCGIIPDIDHPLYFLGWTSQAFFHKYLVASGYIFTGCGALIILTLACRYILWFLRNATINKKY